MKNVKFRPFDEARTYARGLRLSGQAAWREWRKCSSRPSDIPSCPDKAYRRLGWTGWSDWLGTAGRPSRARTYSFLKPFEEARAYARGLGLANSGEWRKWTVSGLRPEGIPSSPDISYAGRDWQGWEDWLGVTYASGQPLRRSFDEARTYVRGLGLQNQEAWYEWASSGARPSDIPANPRRWYLHSGWAGWGDWLGVRSFCP